MRKALLLLAGLSTALAGCEASVQAEASTGKKKEVDFDDPIDPESLQEGDFDENDTGQYALLGARHDLLLSSSASTTPTCQCIAAFVAQAGDGRFQWTAVPPKTNAQTQLVVGLTSDGVSCADVPEGSLGASYWGYERSGDDIVVYVEAAKAGRPVTVGAIIPKPLGNGKVLVKPRGKAPYGRPLSSDEPVCSLGNPGAVQSMDEGGE